MLELESAHLHLREAVRSDLPALLPAYLTNPQFLRWSNLPDYDLASLLRDWEAVHKTPGRFLLGIYHKDAGEAVGVADFLEQNPDDGLPWLGLLIIHRVHQGQGLGLEAYRRLAEHFRTDRDWQVLRLGVLRENREEILEDCDASLAAVPHEWSRHCREATMALRMDLHGPAQSHAANIIDSLVLSLLGKDGRRLACEDAEQHLDDVPLQLAAENLSLRPLLRAFTHWWPSSGIEPPDHFARHATAHGVGHPAVFRPTTALVAVMLAVSLTVQYSPETGDSHASASG